ncbi:hypothetical protein HK100_010867 [Physocladia obscura]|uniref:Flavoprotein domain-containing protein n=1 Tax=Physocladia obscura TaxID=109957 RepID=A0AAD5T3X1_9FUNG|nr:hypothetical protein HK100_010867 [Physocladia obscura]
MLVVATGSVAAIKVRRSRCGDQGAGAGGASCGAGTRGRQGCCDCARTAAQLTAQHGVAALTEADEWAWARRADPLLHVELRSWAHAALGAPLDANSLAKAAGGLCDSLLPCVLRAAGVRRLWCAFSAVCCLQSRIGAMAEVDDIIKAVQDELNILAILPEIIEAKKKHLSHE